MAVPSRRRGGAGAVPAAISLALALAVAVGEPASAAVTGAVAAAAADAPVHANVAAAMERPVRQQQQEQQQQQPEDHHRRWQQDEEDYFRLATAGGRGVHVPFKAPPGTGDQEGDAEAEASAEATAVEGDAASGMETNGEGAAETPQPSDEASHDVPLTVAPLQTALPEVELEKETAEATPEVEVEVAKSGVQVKLRATGLSVEGEDDVRKFGDAVAKLAAEQAGLPVVLEHAEVVGDDDEGSSARAVVISDVASVRKEGGKEPVDVDLTLALGGKKEEAEKASGRVKKWVERNEYKGRVDEAGYGGVTMQVRAGATRPSQTEPVSTESNSKSGDDGKEEKEKEKTVEPADQNDADEGDPVSLGGALGIATGAVSALALVAVMGVWAARWSTARRSRYGGHGGDGQSDGSGRTEPLTQDDDCTGMSSEYGWDEDETSVLGDPGRYARPSDATSYMTASSAGMLDEESYASLAMGGVIVQADAARPAREFSELEDLSNLSERGRAPHSYAFS